MANARVSEARHDYDTAARVDEYAPSFADYVARLAEDEHIVTVVASQVDQVLADLNRIPEARPHPPGDATKSSLPCRPIS